MDAKELKTVLDAAEQVVSADRASALDDSLINTLDQAVKAARAALPSDAAQAPLTADQRCAIETAINLIRTDAPAYGETVRNLESLLAAPVAPAAAAQTNSQIDAIMEQAQVFASAWSLVGGPFDFGNGLENAEQEKANLRELLAWQALPPAKWECAASKHGSVGGNDPAECDWPLCGCDPKATEVIAALQECDLLKDRAAPQPMTPESTADAIDAKFRRQLELRIQNLTVSDANEITWLAISCRGVVQSLYPRKSS